MKSKNGRNKTKGLISLALYSLMLRHPYDEISVKDICEKAGISRMSFYRYYSKKDDIFVDFCDERFEEFYESINVKQITTLNQFSLEVFRYIKKYGRQISILSMANKEFMLLDQLNSYAKYIISNMKADFFKEQKNNPIFAYFMAGGLFNVTMHWVKNGLRNSPEEMNEMLYRLAKY